ncbi:hypothetical protein GCM10010124_27480 [Pilimelia terevasa]|uniref:Uncharacterized protein n=1 Tax=Pilimelia terevasa TaxID=53372 RepID=A0A8J3BS57_9ACTN|nr:delta-60 repeat domain-containing protein [Pilimelia terevasa]GGK33252.1 hypothetical protein GCM10010124_27480 [Pilimelia terevasa]
MMPNLPARPPARPPLRRPALALGTALLCALPAAPAAAIVSSSPMTGTPQFNGDIYASVYAGDTLYLGGDFTSVKVGATTYARGRLAAVDAATGALRPWNPGADGRVRALAATGGTLFVGGEFATLGGVARDGLARVDGGTGAVAPGFRPTVWGQPFALVAGWGKVYVGGTFTAINGATRTRLAALDPADGSVDATWKPTADASVYSLVLGDGRVYVGGDFHNLSGAGATARVAAVHAGSGAVDTGFRSTAKYVAYALALGPAGLYAAHGGPGGRIVGYTRAGVGRWTLTTDGNAQAVGVDDGVVYFGGHFDNVCRTSRVATAHGACLDGSVPRVKLGALSEGGTLSNWTAHGNGIVGVNTIATHAGLHRLAVGGAFTTINGAARKKFAQFP